MTTTQQSWGTSNTASCAIGDYIVTTGTMTSFTAEGCTQVKSSGIDAIYKATATTVNFKVYAGAIYGVVLRKP